MYNYKFVLPKTLSLCLLRLWGLPASNRHFYLFGFIYYKLLWAFLIPEIANNVYNYAYEPTLVGTRITCCIFKYWLSIYKSIIAYNKTISDLIMAIAYMKLNVLVFQIVHQGGMKV